MIVSRAAGYAEKRAWTQRLAFAAAVAAMIALFTPNPLLTVCGFAVVPVIFGLLWRPSEPPVLLFAVLMQWLQVFMPVLNADRHGLKIFDLSLETAAWLSLVTVVVLAIGMRIGVRPVALVDEAVLNEAANRLNVRRLTAAYISAFFLGQVVIGASVLVPSLRQQFLVLAAVRWVVIFLIGWAALRHRRFRTLAAAVVTVELIIGFVGYFSAFKAVLFMAIVLAAASRHGARRLLSPALIGVALVTVLLASFWQSVKDEYSAYINQGDRAQVVRVGLGERLDYLASEAIRTRWSDLEFGFDSTLNRIGYIEMFAATIQNVPTRVPFQDGRLWLEALTHIVTPRVLFPDKAPINDSDRTREFTGLWLAGADEGTSISIGYAGESYIDFGPVIMFVPIALLGYFWGWAYRFLATRSAQKLLGLGFAANLILSSAIYFESSNIKLIGGAVLYVIIMSLLLKYAGDKMWRFVAPSRRALEPRSVTPPQAAAPAPFGFRAEDVGW